MIKGQDEMSGREKYGAMQKRLAKQMKKAEPV